MAATAAQVSQLRRMTAEPDLLGTYSDGDLKTVIESCPTIDALGNNPFSKSGTVNPNWTATYDLPAAAAIVWEEKMAVLGAQFDFNADGASFQRSQVFQQTMALCRYWRARRKPGTITLRPEPKPPSKLTSEIIYYDGSNNLTGIINLAEED